MGSFQMDFHVTEVAIDLTGIVLSGGSSRRMGRDKAMLPVGSVTSIERTALSLRAVCREVLISISNPKSYEFLGLRTVRDIYIGKGPMAGLHACLNRSETAWNMVVACDMPFVSAETMQALIQIAAGDMTRETEVEKTRADLPHDLRDEAVGRTELDAVIPVVGGKAQPLFALYHRDVQTSLANCLSRNELRMMDWLAQLHVLYVPVGDLSQRVGRETTRDLFNMNEPEDYVTACKWVEDSTSGDIS
ncbi:molybdenum cofactor guanylyltransferase [Paenibacillus sp. EC2-1]|uniref:molybdenum cofactor guanylyltransferase n=1 Tax=Paenibacillus sp. EC2-1 TaxID=3388665 RepID=UPI003BEEFB2C